VIELPREVARLFRAVLRKSVLAAEPRSSCPLILLQSGKQGLTLSCQQGDVGLRYHTPGSLATDAIALPFTLLADLEGRGSGTVQLEQISPVKGRVCWSEGTVSFDTATPDSLPPPPQPVGKPTQLEPQFLSALADATRSTNRDAVRYALQHLMLRGKDGAVVATDGRQLLVQRGGRAEPERRWQSTRPQGIHQAVQEPEVVSPRIHERASPPGTDRATRPASRRWPVAVPGPVLPGFRRRRPSQEVYRKCGHGQWPPQPSREGRQPVLSPSAAVGAPIRSSKASQWFISGVPSF